MLAQRPFLITSALTVTVALSALPVTAHGPTVEQEGKATLKTATDEEHGTYVIGGDEHALYLFEADTQGKGETEAISNCYDECAEAWPPLVSEGEPETGGEVRPELVGTIERQDGEAQVTYDGWPLYYYAADQSPGHTRGHDIEDHGAEWYLLTPDGEKVH